MRSFIILAALISLLALGAGSVIDSNSNWSERVSTSANHHAAAQLSAIE